MTQLTPAFDDPVIEAQACFRAVLSAMAVPGSLHATASPLIAPGLDPATAAVLLTLVDGETPLWLDPDLADACQWLAFHAGATKARSAGEARFLCAIAANMPRLDTLDCGTDLAPENSATLVLQLPALEGGPTLMLYGPGLAAPTRAAPAGLPEDFVTQWEANHRLFPRGVDLILCAGDQLCALPRSLRIGRG